MQGGPGVTFLNFEVGPGVSGPTYKLWGDPESRVPSSRVPRSRVSGSWSHFYTMPFKYLSILSPNININFLLFELISRLLIDELSSLLLAFSFVDALSACLCNGVDCFRSMCVLFLFSFFTLCLYYSFQIL